MRSGAMLKGWAGKKQAMQAGRQADEDKTKKRAFWLAQLNDNPKVGDRSGQLSIAARF